MTDKELADLARDILQMAPRVIFEEWEDEIMAIVLAPLKQPALGIPVKGKNLAEMLPKMIDAWYDQLGIKRDQ